MYCKKCGAQIPDDSSFCTACGTSTGSTYEINVASASPTARISKSNHNKKKTLLIIIISFIVVLALAAILLIANGVFPQDKIENNSAEASGRGQLEWEIMGNLEWGMSKEEVYKTLEEKFPGEYILEYKDTYMIMNTRLLDYGGDFLCYFNSNWTLDVIYFRFDNLNPNEFDALCAQLELESKEAPIINDFAANSITSTNESHHYVYSLEGSQIELSEEIDNIGNIVSCTILTYEGK